MYKNNKSQFIYTLLFYFFYLDYSSTKCKENKMNNNNRWDS